MIEQTDISIENWYKAKLIQKNKEKVSLVKLGFSTLYLNRTNRSGIIKGGVIGGVSQDGTYKLDCRFNKEKLIHKIRRIAKYAHRIHFYNLDAIDFLDLMSQTLPKNSFYCIDPPYYVKGSTLYTNAYAPDDHKYLAKFVLKLKSPWIITYDDVPAIQKLYYRREQYRFQLNYSAARKRIGTELMIKSKKLYFNQNLPMHPVN